MYLVQFDHTRGLECRVPSLHKLRLNRYIRYSIVDQDTDSA